jgi:hypothetical protein
VTAHCLEAHDLVVSKLVAGRKKDHDFIEALFRANVADLDVVQTRLGLLDLSRDEVERLRQVARRLAG